MTDPVLTSIAAALAGKGVTALYDLVKAKFAGDRKAADILDSAEGADHDSPEVHALSEHLAKAEETDGVFSMQLRKEWRDFSLEQSLNHGGVSNNISGRVAGNVIQARDIQGGISFR